MQEALRQKNMEIWKNFHDGNYDDIRSIYNDNGSKKVMFTEVAFRPFFWEGIDMVAANDKAGSKWHTYVSDILEIHEMLDPNVFWADMANEARYIDDDGSVRNYHNTYIQYFRCRDGKMDEWREYYNSCMRAEFDGLKMPEYEGMPPVELDKQNLARAIEEGSVKYPGDYPIPLSDEMPDEMLRARNEGVVREFLATPCKERIRFIAKDAVKKCMFTEKYRQIFRWDGWDLIAENQRRNSREGNIQTTILHMHPGKDPNLFIVEAISTGPTFLGHDRYGLYANEYIYLFKLKNGLITEWREYYNALARGKQAGIFPVDFNGPGDPTKRDAQALSGNNV